MLHFQKPNYLHIYTLVYRNVNMEPDQGCMGADEAEQFRVSQEIAG